MPPGSGARPPVRGRQARWSDGPVRPGSLLGAAGVRCSSQAACGDIANGGGVDDQFGGDAAFPGSTTQPRRFWDFRLSRTEVPTGYVDVLPSL